MLTGQVLLVGNNLHDSPHTMLLLPQHVELASDGVNENTPGRRFVTEGESSRQGPPCRGMNGRRDWEV